MDRFFVHVSDIEQGTLNDQVTKVILFAFLGKKLAQSLPACTQEEPD